jgi:hypothetical protein
MARVGSIRYSLGKPCGATYPCFLCGMSQRNTIHQNKTQFNYHEYVHDAEKEGSDQSGEATNDAR